MRPSMVSLLIRIILSTLISLPGTAQFAMSPATDTCMAPSTAVRTSAGTFDTDLVVLGLGVKPATDLAAAAGLEIGETGGIVTDERMATSAEGVWAAGDCAEIYHRVSKRRVAIARRDPQCRCAEWRRSR